jgi:hypothetical protein
MRILAALSGLFIHCGAAPQRRDPRRLPPHQGRRQGQGNDGLPVDLTMRMKDGSTRTEVLRFKRRPL